MSEPKSRLPRVSIIGSRGIPAQYGGFETVAENLASRLAAKGYPVLVSCEGIIGSRPSQHAGAKLVYFPWRQPKSYTARKPYEILYDMYMAVRLARASDVMLVLGSGPNIILALSRLLNPRLRILMNIDGCEWKRSKFNVFERFLAWAFVWSSMIPSQVVVLDAEAMRRHIPRWAQKKAVCLLNGVAEVPTIPWNTSRIKSNSRLRAHADALTPGGYWLMVARMEPENNIKLELEGYLKSNARKPLVVVGDFTSKKYRAEIESILASIPNNQVIRAGAIYDLGLLNMLRQNALGYLHGHSVGGTAPSLLEAMVMRNLILAHDNEFNREVCAETAQYFANRDDLAVLIRQIELNPDSYVRFRTLSHARAADVYSWARIVQLHEDAFTQPVESRRS